MGEPDVNFFLSIPCALSGVLPLFIGDLARVLQSLPACSLMGGDVNIDLNPHNNSFHNHTTKSYMDVFDDSVLANDSVLAFLVDFV